MSKIKYPRQLLLGPYTKNDKSISTSEHKKTEKKEQIFIFLDVYQLNQTFSLPQNKNFFS